MQSHPIELFVTNYTTMDSSGVIKIERIDNRSKNYSKKNIIIFRNDEIN